MRVLRKKYNYQILKPNTNSSLKITFLPRNNSWIPAPEGNLSLFNVSIMTLSVPLLRSSRLKNKFPWLLVFWFSDLPVRGLWRMVLVLHWESQADFYQMWKPLKIREHELWTVSSFLLQSERASGSLYQMSLKIWKYVQLISMLLCLMLHGISINSKIIYLIIEF